MKRETIQQIMFFVVTGALWLVGGIAGFFLPCWLPLAWPVVALCILEVIGLILLRRPLAEDAVSFLISLVLALALLPLFHGALAIPGLAVGSIWAQWFADVLDKPNQERRENYGGAAGES